MSKLIPNSFQHPNIFIDQLAYYLTPNENVVLTKATREILGWHNKIERRKAAISLSVFVDGKTSTETGEILCHGCGLGIQAVRKALKALDEFKILVKVGQPTKDGQLYWLQDDETNIKWKELKERRQKTDKENKDRTGIATQKSLKKRGVTSDGRGNVGRNSGVTSDVRHGVTSDVNKETQLEKQLETQHGGGASFLSNQTQNNLPKQTKPAKNTENKKTATKSGSPQKTQLSELFIQETGIRQPKNKSDIGWWWNGINRFLDVADNDNDIAIPLMIKTIKTMKERELTISDPNSLIKMARAAMSEGNPKVRMKY